MCLVVLGACSNLAGPDYQRPETPEKEAWSRAPDPRVSPATTVRRDWWTGFRDPYLDSLVDQAIAQGIDLRILAARVDEARAALGREQAATQPTVRGSTEAALTRSRPEVLPGEFADPVTSRQYSAQVSLSWELDIWGKLEKGVQAQQAGLRATEAEWRAGYLTLVSDVAETYFLIRQLDEQRQQQEAALEKNRQILAILERQLDNGIVPQTRVLQQRAEVRDLEQQLLDLRRRRGVAENQLATLVGVSAGNLKVPEAGLRATVQPLQVPAGLPSDLLERRPDIVAAEYRVLQAHDLVGQARLARLPSFSLTGEGGLASSVLSKLLKGFTLGLAPSIDIPIFDPETRTQVLVNEAQARTAEERYRKTVLTAFEEVENALVNLAYRKDQRRVITQQVEDLRVVDAQVRRQLDAGLVSQLELFESERTLLAAEQRLLAVHQQILTDTVTLYKALGGGWPSAAVSRTTTQ
ncbi:MAG: efflux transporter outer membrane subunit [Ectothiorhodospiraceae bacterium]